MFLGLGWIGLCKVLLDKKKDRVLERLACLEGQKCFTLEVLNFFVV